jgi:uncharacterized protein
MPLELVCCSFRVRGWAKLPSGTRVYPQKVPSNESKQDREEKASTEATLPFRGRRRPESKMVELSREECLELLAAHSFGRLAVVMTNGAPVIRPVNYVFDKASQSVVFRTARGSKLHALLHAAKAAFEIDGIDETARTGWSVIIQGVTAEIDAPIDVGRLNKLGLQSWAPGPKPHLVRIRAWTVSGRRIVLPPDNTAGHYLG